MKQEVRKDCYESLLHCLEQLFPECDRHECDKVAQLTTFTTLQNEQIVLYEGSQADCLHIICSGKVRINKVPSKSR